MKRFKKAFLIMITAILFMVLSVGSAYAGNGNNGKGNPGKALGHFKGNVNIFINFSDVKGHWAEDSIALMTAEGIIKGYSDNSFKTEKPVTREEAITMIMRMLGSGVSNVYDAYLPSSLKKSWAKDYLAMAVQKGILTEEDFGKPFNKPAERCEVATWLVRALGMEDEGLIVGKYLVFKDESAIPDWARNSVRVAARYGIIQGYPDHVFQPRKPIKRAEMAAVMARVRHGFCHEIHTPQLGFTFIRGEIAEIDDGRSPSVTIDRDGWLSDLEVPLMDQTLVYLNGKSADLDDLDEGNNVFVLVDSDGYAIVIMARSGEHDDDLDDEVVSGIFRLIDDDEIYVWVDGDTIRYILDDDVEVKIDDEEAGLDDLKKGFDVVLEIEDGLVTEIKAESGYEEVTGTFRAIDDDIIYVIIDGDTARYRLDNDVEVTIDGEKADLEDLERGYEVELTLKDKIVTKIKAETGVEEVEAVFRSIDDNDVLHVRIDGKRALYNLDDDVEVIIDGKKAGLKDLKYGYEVVLTVEDGVVVKIEADSGVEEVEAVFRSIDDNDVLHVRIDGKRALYNLDDDVEVIIDGKKAGLKDLKYGYEVVLTVEDGVVVKIEADSGIEKVTGVFRGLKDDTIYIVVDKLTTGYDLAGDVEVIINGDEGEIGDLEAGDEVTIYVEEDADEVIKIEARVVVID